MRGAGRGTLVGRSTDPCPDTPGGVSASKAFGSYFAKVVGKGYMEGVGRHNFCMPFPTEIPNHLIALKKHWHWGQSELNTCKRIGITLQAKLRPHWKKISPSLSRHLGGISLQQRGKPALPSLLWFTGSSHWETAFNLGPRSSLSPAAPQEREQTVFLSREGPASPNTRQSKGQTRLREDLGRRSSIPSGHDAVPALALPPPSSDCWDAEICTDPDPSPFGWRQQPGQTKKMLLHPLLLAQTSLEAQPQSLAQILTF